MRPGCDQAALSLMARPLHRQQHRSAPLAADADALKHTQNRQDDRAPDSDRLVGRHERDEEGRDAHAQKRGDERRLAADAVPVMAEDRGADGTSDKTDEIGAERRERAGQRIFVGKVELAEDQPGGGAVDEEVIPFDGGADGGRDDGPAQLPAVLGVGHRRVYDCRGHFSSPTRFAPADLRTNHDQAGAQFQGSNQEPCAKNRVRSRRRPHRASPAAARYSTNRFGAADVRPWAGMVELLRVVRDRPRCGPPYWISSA